MKKIILPVYISLVLNTALDAQTINKFEFNWEAENQNNVERVFKKDLKPIEEILSLEESELYEFAYLDVDSDGNLVGYDFSKERIIYFPANDYQSIIELTNGIGRGPKELRLPRDLKFDEKGNIWGIDLEGGRIQSWSKINEIVKNFKSDRKYVRPYKLAVCNTYVYVLSEQYLGQGLYHKFNLEGDYI